MEKKKGVGVSSNFSIDTFYKKIYENYKNAILEAIKLIAPAFSIKIDNVEEKLK